MPDDSQPIRVHEVTDEELAASSPEFAAHLKRGSTLERAARELMEATTVNDEPLSERAMAYNVPLLTATLKRAFRAFMDAEYDHDPDREGDGEALGDPPEQP